LPSDSAFVLIKQGPTIVRLAWHCSGTYDKNARDGGSGGGTIRFKNELAHGANAGLALAVQWMEPIKSAHPNMSYGDLYTLAGVEAISYMGGPQVHCYYTSLSLYVHTVILTCCC
jgi:cytochrome c peroxidase